MKRTCGRASLIFLWVHNDFACTRVAQNWCHTGAARNIRATTIAVVARLNLAATGAIGVRCVTGFSVSPRISSVTCAKQKAGASCRPRSTTLCRLLGCMTRDAWTAPTCRRCASAITARKRGRKIKSRPKNVWMGRLATWGAKNVWNLGQATRAGRHTCEIESPLARRGDLPA